MVRPTGEPVACFEPPPDVITKGVEIKAELMAKELGKVLEGTLISQVAVERIRRIDPPVAAFEVVDFRFCVQYANGLLGPAQFQEFQKMLGLFSASRSEKSPSIF